MATVTLSDVGPVCMPTQAAATAPGLTRRQVAVLEYMAQGQAIEGIAGHMAYAESTIKKEVHFIVRRMGARNRTHAVALAIRAGII